MKRSMKNLAIGALLATAFAAPAMANDIGQMSNGVFDTGQTTIHMTAMTHVNGATGLLVIEDGVMQTADFRGAVDELFGNNDEVAMNWSNDGGGGISATFSISGEDILAFNFGTMQDHQGAVGATGSGIFQSASAIVDPGQFETDMTGAGVYTIASLFDIDTHQGGQMSDIYQTSAKFGQTMQASDAVVTFAWADDTVTQPQHPGSFALIAMLGLDAATMTADGQTGARV